MASILTKRFAQAQRVSVGRAAFASSKTSASGNNNNNNNSRGLFSWYSKSLEKRPLVTKAITSGCITLAGDVACQMVFERSKQFDANRALRFFVTGTLLVGPALHSWYGFLFKKFPPSAGGGLRSTLARLACDQLLFAPCFIPMFIGFVYTLEGGAEKLTRDMPATLRNEWGNMVVTNWTLWIPAMFVNFNFVPGPYQVLFSNAVGVVWNMYLSWKAN